MNFQSASIVPNPLKFLRQDMIYAKALGFNMVRFIAGVAFTEQLDLCDELGLMVYEESLAGWMMENSPRFLELYDQSIKEMIRRDRNHASVVIWGLLNETNDGPVFRHAVESLSMVREMDPSRLIILNSGRWDRVYTIGSLSNPESMEWDGYLGQENSALSPDSPLYLQKNMIGGYIVGMGDVHYYPSYPLTPQTIAFMQTLGTKGKSIFLSEHGVGSENNAVRLVKLYEQQGATENLEDLLVYQSERDKFLEDWKKFGLDKLYADPDNFFQDSHRIQAQHRRTGLSVIRSNPKIIGYNITGLIDQGRSSEGIMCTTFRELKPGMADILKNGWSSLRWCIFVEPINLYSGNSITLEVVLVNEDILLPGDYEYNVRILGPHGKLVLEKNYPLQIAPDYLLNAPFTQQLCKEDIIIDGPAGKYEIAVGFIHGAAPACGQQSFWVGKKTQLPLIESDVILWESGTELHALLEQHGVNLF